jgi:GMP synthase-like glutamine amidotransferase
MRVQVLQHVDFEDAAGILDWAAERGHGVAATLLHAGQRPPHLDDFDLLVVMGGPMNIYEHEEHPWLADEKRFLRQAVDAGKGVLGVCLGAQLLCDVLGGHVRQGLRKEIGWLPVRLLPEAGLHPLFRGLYGEFTPFHWHGDACSLPPGALRLAESDACPVQAFAHGGRVLGLQFHLETTPASMERLITHCGHEICAGPCIQDSEHMRQGLAHQQAAKNLLDTLLDRLTKELTA